MTVRFYEKKRDKFCLETPEYDARGNKVEPKKTYFTRGEALDLAFCVNIAVSGERGPLSLDLELCRWLGVEWVSEKRMKNKLQRLYNREPVVCDECGEDLTLGGRGPNGHAKGCRFANKTKTEEIKMCDNCRKGEDHECSRKDDQTDGCCGGDCGCDGSCDHEGGKDNANRDNED